MKRLEITDAEMMMLVVQNEISRSEDARYDHRLHGILLVSRGFSCYEVASMLGHTPRTIENWVNRFEDDGLAGLQEKLRSGRPPKIEKQELNRIGKDLRRDPRDFGYEQNLWDGKLLGYHLSKEYNISLGVRQCQRMFHVLQFRRRKPRPVIANADPVAQKLFKKNCVKIFNAQT